MVSDTYTLRFLLQATTDTPSRAHWREVSGGGFESRVDGVDILLTEIHVRTGSRIGLRFRHAEDEFWLYSPQHSSWFGGGYASEDDRELAELLTELLRAATAQCERKAVYDFEHPNEVRARVYQQLLFGAPRLAADSGAET